MKKVIALLFVAMLFNACKEIDKLTMFEMDYESSVTVPSTVGVNVPVDLFTPDIATDSEATYESNNTHKDLIEEIRLTKMKLDIILPTDEDFSFLESISVSMNAEGLSEKKIAWNEDVSATPGSAIELEVSPDDLQEYIKKDKFSLKVTTVTDELITEDYEIKISSTFFVDAKILGL